MNQPTRSFKKKFFNLVTKKIDSSTFHGIAKILHAKKLFHKLYWLAILLYFGKNSSGDTTRVLTTFSTTTKLTLEIYSDNSSNTGGKGIHVILHDQDHYVEFNYGFNVPTGLQTDIAFSKVKLKLKPVPYSNCSYTGLEEFLYKNYSENIKRDNIRYSSSQCKLDCFDDNLSGYCGYNRQRKELNSGHHKCAIDFTENIWYKLYGFCESSCPLECSTDLYDYKMGFLNFPSDETYFERLNSSEVIFSDGFEKLKQNVLRLTIRFEKITYTLIEQEPKMMPVDLIATIGGTLGRFRE